MTIMVALLATCIAFVSCSDNATSKSYKYHKDNIKTLSSVVDSSMAESMLSALETSCAIGTNTKLVAEDMREINDNCYELYAGLMVRFYIQDGQLLLYTFETYYNDDSKILLYNSSSPDNKKVLTETERKSLIYTQREYVVHTTIEITPASGFILHNALGTSKVQLTFKNRSDTTISSVDILMTPYISGVSFDSKNASYSMLDTLAVNNSITKTVIIPEWSNYDSYKIIKVIVAFSDGTIIAFDSFDCQFLDSPIAQNPSLDNDSTDTSDNESNGGEEQKPPMEDDSNSSTNSENNPNVEEKPTSEGLKYDLSSDEKSYYVWAYEGTAKIVQIPDTYNSLPVTAIGPGAFENCTSITKVIIPNSVVTINYSAFYDCTNLEDLIIPSSLKICKTYIASYCPKMKYNEYKGLSYLGNSENPYVLLVKVNDKNLRTYEINETCKVFGNSVFKDCKNLESITIPSAIEFIEENSFNACTNLKTVILPENLESINGRAFSGCIALRQLQLPDSLMVIGDSAFYECENLNVVNIPKNVVYINSCSFYKCSSLKNIELPYGLQKIGASAFAECKNLISINIPISIKEIEGLAFRGCDVLTISFETSYIPTHFDKNWNYTNCSRAVGVNNIETNSNFNYVVHEGKAFLTKYKGTNLNVSIPATIEGYPIVFYKRIFENSTVENVIIEEGLSFIDNYAFYDVDTLKTISIPNSVISIGDYAFYDCDGIKNIDIPDNIEIIGECAFKFCDNLRGNEYKNCKYFGNANNPYLVLVSVWGTGCSSYTIHEDTKLIAPKAFYNCNVENITIPDSVTMIGAYAFQNCYALTSVVIGNGVTNIGDFAFDSCQSLTNLVIGNNVTNIGQSAFACCSSLKSVVIPDSVKSIGEHAFWVCINLTIYCEAESKPDDWDSTWNYSSPIYWYSEILPTINGNYWHYNSNREIVVW